MSADQILDSPISDRAQEKLGRLSFADGISNLILQAPENSSFRIGIYGEWGEGKTSVLKMVQLRLEEKGQPCVWLLPWAYSDPTALWTGLLDSIATKLNITKNTFQAAQKGYQLLTKVIRRH